MEDLTPQQEKQISNLQQRLTKWESFFIKLGTTVAIGTFAFAWKTNSQLTILINHDQQHTNKETDIQTAQDKHQNQLNNAELYLRDLNGRLILIEKTQK